jgi:hypothetical protein
VQLFPKQQVVQTTILPFIKYVFVVQAQAAVANDIPASKEIKNFFIYFSSKPAVLPCKNLTPTV